MSPAKGNIDHSQIINETTATTKCLPPQTTGTIENHHNYLQHQHHHQNNQHSSGISGSNKNILTNKIDDIKAKFIDEKLKIETPLDEELLGSVTTLSSPAVRTSARVIQKMKMDSIRPVSPPVPDKKEIEKLEKIAQKTPNQPKPIKVIWTNIERNLLFDAINEFGKDFESIAHYINLKQRRKSPAVDPMYKTKDHVRLLYYQTFHKVTKYLRFSDEIKKHAQELYALINYGEMRKKLIFVNQKACTKLKELVYKGSVTIRVKGKNIRIKTPSCKALRKLNQLEEWQEEIKLPSKVDVFLKPANTEAWGRVQTLAQNPRIKIILPLQKRVVSLLKTLQTRWRSRDVRLCEQTMQMFIQNNKHQSESKSAIPEQVTETIQLVTDQDQIIRLAPPSNTVIHRPMVNLSEFLSSYSICLNSYEDRIGVRVKGETLLVSEAPTSKRQRHDSGSIDKKSPEYKRARLDINEQLKSAATNNNTTTTSTTNTTASNQINNTTKGEMVINDPTALVKDQLPPTTTNPTISAENDDIKMVNHFEMDGILKIESLNDENDTTTNLKYEILSPSSTLFNEINTSSIDVTSINDTNTPPTITSITTTMTQAPQTSETKNDNNETVIVNDIMPLTTTTNTTITTSNSTLTSTTTNTTNTTKEVSTPGPSAPPQIKTKKKESKSQTNKKLNPNKREQFRPLLNDEIIREIKRGWCLDDVGDLTIGDLYIMFGQDFRVHLDYSWMDRLPSIKLETSMQQTPSTLTNFVATTSSAAIAITIPTTPSMTITPTTSPKVLATGSVAIDLLKTEPSTEDDDKLLINNNNNNGGSSVGHNFNNNNNDNNLLPPMASSSSAITNNTNILNNKLKQLLLLASMNEKLKKKNNCTCGHFCDRCGYKFGGNKDEILPRSFISNKIYPSSHNDNGLFRQPVLPSLRNSGIAHLEAFRLNLNQARNKQSRWIKTSRLNSRSPKQQVVVQRLLPIQPGVAHSYDVVSTTTLSMNSQSPSLSTTTKLYHLSQHSHLNMNTSASLSPSTSSSAASSSTSSASSATSSTSSSSNQIDELSKLSSLAKPTSLPSSSVPQITQTPTTITPQTNKQTTETIKNNKNIRNQIPLKLTPSSLSASTTTSTTKSMPMIADDSSTSTTNCSDYPIKDLSSLDDDPGMQSLMEISLPSPAVSISIDELDFNCSNSSNPAMMSPMRILRQSPTDPKWFDDNVNDFSLSSFLGHLENACNDNVGVNSNCSISSTNNGSGGGGGGSGSSIRKSSLSSTSSTANQIESSNMSTLSETSIDYMSKFEELAKSMINEQAKQSNL